MRNKPISHVHTWMLFTLMVCFTLPISDHSPPCLSGQCAIVSCVGRLVSCVCNRKMGIVDRSRLIGLAVDTSDASMTDNLVLESNLLAAAFCLIGLLMVLIVIVSCACCDAGDTHARQVPEEDLEDGQPSKKSERSGKSQHGQQTKAQVRGNQKHVEPHVDKRQVDSDMIPFQVRKAPPPTSHKIPLAPPGGTVPPLLMPGDDDPTVNVEAKSMKKSAKV